MDFHSEDFVFDQGNNEYRWILGNLGQPSQCRQVTIDMLPDDVLLEIFAFYVEENNRINAWYTLVHVCRKWRIVVFGSPCRLNLRLKYDTSGERARQTLDIWPPLPIVLWGVVHPASDMDKIMAALQHNDRVCDIDLWASIAQLENAFEAMQEPFPALTNLLLRSINGIAPVIPESFLGGSAPRLQELALCDIPFPGLWKLLSSATRLVRLNLQRIPHSGYISPEAMVTCLSTLTRLERLYLNFQSPQSRPDRESRRPPPLTRSVLPALTDFRFKGVSEYLEDFVARIDAPTLHELYITFFHQLIFDTPNLSQFISRTPNLKAHDEARVVVSDSDVRIVPVHRPDVGRFPIDLGISCRHSDWQLSSLTQVCRSSFPPSFISSLENLHIRDGFPHPRWQDDIENVQWLELLHPFTAVKNLYLSKEFTPCIAPVLQELVGERVIEILPALQSLFLEEVNPAGRVQEAIGRFIAARQLSGHPIAISYWEVGHLW